MEINIADLIHMTLFVSKDLINDRFEDIRAALLNIHVLWDVTLSRLWTLGSKVEEQVTR